MEQADIGVIGLAVMGQNLVLNMADHHFTVVVFNRTEEKTKEFLEGPARGKSILGAHNLVGFVSKLKRPRRIMLMVKAGEPVDELIAQLLPYLEMGDILIDGGNSFFMDTQRRYEMLSQKGIFYLGVGVSGGEEGARHGPSMMPGGHLEAWPHVQNIFQSIAARAENEPCCNWVGMGGSGHYVKMVHNGIEYGDMQLICEAYDLLHRGVGLSFSELGDLFAKWNRGPLESYLIEITAEIFSKLDSDGSPLMEKILDVAGQKGTGKWTIVNALDLGMPITLIGEAVFARNLSALKEERELGNQRYPFQKPSFNGEMQTFCQQVADALYASKIASYAQGFMLMHKASMTENWKLNFSSIAQMWRGGCIIQSQFLGKITQAYLNNPNLSNLLLDPFFVGEMTRCHTAWREVVAKGVMLGIPLPCFSAGLAFFDGYRSSRLPANLLQAQRDFFGAHTYERVDRPRGQFFHTNWTGQGMDVSSSSYNA